ncbi:MAG: roadblock/LC7 domain-containing protein [Gammaproteobacteria bacterium]|nr:roadblock/LC7 domain-containing protein [Gammaproteobacteria bacterium]
MRHKMFTVLITELCDSSSDIDLAALVDADGTVMAGSGLSGLHEDQFGAVVSSALSLGELAGGTSGAGALEHLLLEAADARLVLVRAGEDKALAVRASKTVALEELLREVKWAAESVTKFL